MSEKPFKYSRVGVLTLNSIFPNDPKVTKSLIKKCASAPPGKLQTMYKAHDNAEVVRKVFSTLFKIIVGRVVNGEMFVFPGTTGATIRVSYLSNDETKKVKQLGLYKEINISKSRHKIPRVIFDFGPNINRYPKHLYLPDRYKEVLYENAESGKLSYIEVIKCDNNAIDKSHAISMLSTVGFGFEEITPIVKDMFKYIDSKCIDKISRRGLYSILRLMRTGEELFIRTDNFTEFKFFTPMTVDNHANMMRFNINKRNLKNKINADNHK